MALPRHPPTPSYKSGRCGFTPCLSKGFQQPLPLPLRRRKLHILRAGLRCSPALNRFALHLAAKTIPGRRESSARQSCGCGKTSLPESAPGGGRSVFSSRTKTHFVGLFVRFWIGQRAGAFDGPPKPLLAQGRLWWWECFRATDSGHLWQWRFATAGGR